MNLDAYQRKAFATARIDWGNSRTRHIPTFGVIGELGSLTSELKKSLRDGKAYTDGSRNLIEEFGDLLWYVAAIASRHDLRLQELLDSTPATPRAQHGTFSHIYGMVSAFAKLVALVPDLGADLHSSEKRRLAHLLGQSLRCTLIAIHREQIRLETVLTQNLRKVTGAFGSEVTRPAPCFDAHFPIYEQLPRRTNVQFLERSRGKGRLEVVLRVNEINIGDRLTDNAAKDDGYRFHDAFHLAYTAVLGWSPVVRTTFRCKRKSDSQVDEIQDGARAAIIEEAISQTVFNYARGHSMLEGLDRIDHGILKLIRTMVRGLEVKRCALHEWQRAIFVGFQAFRALKRNRGGWLLLDAEARSLTYSKDGPLAD